MTGVQKSRIRLLAKLILYFKDWCTKRAFDDGSLVHEDKLILWLDDVVLKHGGADKLSRKRKSIGKQEKGKGKVRRIEAGSQGILAQEIMGTEAPRPDPEPEIVELSSDLGWELIEGWIAAILNLYHKQVWSSCLRFFRPRNKLADICLVG